jgi:hypothetical protein
VSSPKNGRALVTGVEALGFLLAEVLQAHAADGETGGFDAREDLAGVSGLTASGLMMANVRSVVISRDLTVGGQVALLHAEHQRHRDGDRHRPRRPAERP